MLFNVRMRCRAEFPHVGADYRRVRECYDTAGHGRAKVRLETHACDGDVTCSVVVRVHSPTAGCGGAFYSSIRSSGLAIMNDELLRLMIELLSRVVHDTTEHQRELLELRRSMMLHNHHPSTELENLIELLTVVIKAANANDAADVSFTHVTGRKGRVMDLSGDERQELMAFRRQALLQRMREISESFWASGWYHGMDAILYRIAFEGASPEFGRGVVSPSEQALLREYAMRAESWFRRDDDDVEPLAISLHEAKARFERIRPAGTDGIGRTVQEVRELYERSLPSDWMPAFERPDDFPSWMTKLHVKPVARETYEYRSDKHVTLDRRSDMRFNLCYGDCEVRIVEPSWIGKVPPRAAGCTLDRPCRDTRRCVWCVEAMLSGDDDDAEAQA